jgi:hypothetical protein
MRNVFKLAGLFLLVLILTFGSSCKKKVPPSVTTNSVTEISYTTAVSGGNVTDEGSAPVLSRGTCWSTTENPTIENSKTSDAAGSGTFTSNIDMLSPNTAYYVRSYATSGDGTGYGNEVSFKTNPVTTPELITTEVNSITNESAVCGGNITSENGGMVTARGICWSTSANPTITDSKTSDGTGSGTFLSNITGLSESTTYHVRAYATNSAGTAYGQDIELFTQINPKWLMVFYPLDGNANDLSTHNLNGIVTGAQLTANRNNIADKAMSFSGTNSFISLGSNFDYPVRTINIWFNATIIDLSERHIYISDSPMIQYGFTQIKVKEINGIPQIRSSAGIPGGTAEGNAAISINQWYMITLVVDPVNTRHYLNGELIGIYGNGLAHSNNGDMLALLGTSRVYDRSFVGKIDDVRIYDKALSQAEIKNLLKY